jgi:hypothetical protein
MMSAAWTGRRSPTYHAFCWLNAVFALPYLASALYSAFRGLSDPVYREYRHEPSLLLVAFVLFHAVLFYGLARRSVWVTWFVMADSASGLGLALLYCYGFGAYLLVGHPAAEYYLLFHKAGEDLGGAPVFLYFLALKAVGNTCNLAYLGRLHAARLVARSVVWVASGALLILVAVTYLPVLSVRDPTRSEQATEIAKREFAAIACEKVREHLRERGSPETTYVRDGFRVAVTYDYNFTGVWVTGPDGKRGMAGGPRYFCRPGYVPPR